MGKSFTVTARIGKYDIPALGELKGHVNDRTVEIDGRQYRRATIRFDGFAGSHSGDHVFEGVYHLYHDDATVDGPHADLSVLNDALNSEGDNDADDYA